MRYEAFIGGSYQAQSTIADCEHTINLYVEGAQSPRATAGRALYRTPGVSIISEVVNGSGRGHFAMDEREFYIIGDTLYEITAQGAVTNRGTVAVDTNPATITSNGDGGNQLFITSGGNGYVFDLGTNTLTAIAALSGAATQGGYLDGYFVALDANTSTLYVSALLDGATWNTGTVFAQRSLAPDPWRAMKIVGRFIWLFGEFSTEIWQDVGTTLPFAPYPGGLLNVGIAAPFSASIVGSDLVWFAQDATGSRSVLRATGLAPETISTFPLEQKMAKYQNFAGALSDSYSENGHTFYLLNFDDAGVTHAWDAKTGEWCDRGTWHPSTNSYTAWRPRYYAFAFGEHRILDVSGGALYKMGIQYNTDVEGVPIRWLRRAPAPQSEGRRVTYNSFELDLEMGLGTVSGQGVDPQVMLRVSNDGGKTWVSEQWRSAGKIGEYIRRAKWNRLGQARRRVFEVAGTDPVPVRILGANLDLQVEQVA